MSLLARVVLLAALACLPGAARADGLFVDLPAGATLAGSSPPAAIPGTVKRSRLVSLDTAYLDTRILGGRIQPGQAISLPPILLPLFPDLPVQALVAAREVMAGGQVVWRGQPEGVTGFVNLVVSGTQVTGQVQLGDRVIEIRPGPFGLHRIIEIDQSFFPREARPARARPRPVSPGAPAQIPNRAPDRAADGNTTINVLVVYGDRSASESSNIVSEIQLAVATSNTVYTNSGIPITLNLVGTQEMIGYVCVVRTFGTDGVVI